MLYWHSHRKLLEGPVEGKYKVKSKAHLRKEDVGRRASEIFSNIVFWKNTSFTEKSQEYYIEFPDTLHLLIFPYTVSPNMNSLYHLFLISDK